MLKQSRVDRVYLAVGSTDLRKSIDGLSLIVQESFKLDPFSRHLFVFCNRKRDKIKILEWDKNGFWLHYKRLEKNTFRWPDGTEGSSLMIDERQFRWLLDGLSIHQEDVHPDVKERILI
jgi:transposase